VAVLTDDAGREAAQAAGLPVLVVDDPRSVLGGLAAYVLGDPARAFQLVGITGTNGKTTTAYLVDAALRESGLRTGLIGTVETRVGDDARTSVRTTPEAPELQQLFAEMRDAGVQAVAMEVSSHALALGRVDGTRFDLAVFTNLGRDHLDFHGDLEDYYAAKASLFTPERAEEGLVCVDDDAGRRLAGEARVPVQTLSTDGGDADWQVRDVRLGPDGSTFTLAGPAGALVPLRVAIPGRFNVTNAALAAAALLRLGRAEDEVVRGIAACTGVPGRMERVSGGQRFLAVVDYAHTPDAVESALTSLREVTKHRLVVVLGCGGDRDKEKRPLMGEVAARLADVVVFTNDNPRSEEPRAILAAMEEGAHTVPERRRAQVETVPDRAAAIAKAVGVAGDGDTVAVLGKGHETGQEVAGEVRPFDDRAVLAEAVAAVLA
jgi:UDP-N-acetylmuramoyl-L-alanyl-D-glutamate--2,6-diaminopimelate ligase